MLPPNTPATAIFILRFCAKNSKNCGQIKHTKKQRKAKMISDEKRKSIRKTIRFSPDQLKKITEKANDLQLNFSQYIVYSATNQRVGSKKNPLYKDLITQLAKVGNNLNQIAKICNTEKTINKQIVSSLVTTISALQTQLNQIVSKLSTSGADDDL